MGRVYNFKEMNRAMKRAQVREWIHGKVNDFRDWFDQNWALRRELTNREWIEIDRRKKNGERLADILNELKVLK